MGCSNLPEQEKKEGNQAYKEQKSAEEFNAILLKGQHSCKYFFLDITPNKCCFISGRNWVKLTHLTIKWFLNG